MSHSFRSIAVSNRLRAFALFALVLSMVSVQFLGLFHRALHANNTRAVVVSATVVSGEVSSGGLFEHQGVKVGDGECRLYDQLSLGDIAPVAVLPVLPLRLMPLIAEFGPATLVNLPSAWFLARAPPLIC